ncbi:MAG: hypothetical protein AAB354_05110, partial [candidate division KSB1 bacterium]
SKEEVGMLIEAIQKEKAQLRARGERASKLKIAQVMLRNGEPMEKIKLYTGLSNEASAKLKKSGQQ